MRCKEFAAVLEQDGIAPLPAAAQDHLASCGDCQNYLADLSTIVGCANELPAEAEPPQRIWVSLRAQLEAEGLIHEPGVLVSGPAYGSGAGWLETLRGWLTPRTLATAGVGIALALAAFVQLHKPTIVANHAVTTMQPQVQAQVQTPVQQPSATPSIAQKVQVPSTTVPIQHVAVRTANPVIAAPAPSDDVYVAWPAAISDDEKGLPEPGDAGNPAVDAALRKNLATVNAFIAECKAHLKKHPQDTLASEYLNRAYQQKAELLAALLDSGRSEQ